MNTIFVIHKSFVYTNIMFPAKCIYIEIGSLMQYLEV